MRPEAYWGYGRRAAAKDVRAVRMSLQVSAPDETRCGPRTSIPSQAPLQLDRHERVASPCMRAVARTVEAYPQKESAMIKFHGKTAGILFLIGLAVVIGLLMLIF